MKVKLVRGVFIGKTPRVKGDLLDVEDRFARELVAMGKAEYVDESAAVSRGPMTTKTAEALTAGGGK